MKKLLSVIMAVAMMISMSVVSFAATTVTTIEQLTEAVANGGDIVLGADIEISSSLRVNKDVKLDLNGHVLTGPHNYVGGTNLYAFIVEESGILTLDDTSAAQTGEISCKYSGIETKGGSFVMNGGKITAADAYLAVAIVNYGGSVVINDGIVNAYYTAITTQAYFTDSAVTDVNGGEINLIESENNFTVFEVGGEYNNGYSNVFVYEGEINGNDEDIFACDKEKGSIYVDVCGGTFSAEIPQEYIGYGLVQDENGTVVSAFASISCDLDGKTFKANEAYEFTVTVERKDYDAPLTLKLNLDPNGLVKLETPEEGGWVEVPGNEIMVTGILGNFVQYDFRVTYSEEGEHSYSAFVGYYSDESNMFDSFDDIDGSYVVKGVADDSSSGSSSGSSSAPSSRPSRDDDDDEGITDIVPGNKKPEGEENPNTGAPIMLPIATAVAALCGLYISKKK